MFQQGDGMLQKGLIRKKAHILPQAMHRATVSISVGRWRKCLGEGRRPAYICRFVRMHVGVGQRGRALDVESTALQAKKKRSSSRGRWKNCQGGFKIKHSPSAMPAVPKSRARAQQSVSSRVSSMGRWRTCQGRFKMQTLTFCNAKITSTRTAVGQFKGQFNGAMDESSGKVQDASTHK